MSEYQIITDATCDLAPEILDAYPLHVIEMLYTLEGNGYSYHPSQPDTLKPFYAALREGKSAQSSQISSFVYEQEFEKFLSQGIDVLYLCFSSQLSGTYQTATVVVDQLQKKYPDRKIKLVDTLGASAGEGLIVYRALNAQKDGKSMEEVIAYLQQTVIQQTAHWFTVDDLKHLNRTGRLSNGAAWLGYVFKIKPILTCNSEGRLVPEIKVTGRKAAIKKLYSIIAENPQQSQDVIFISHADVLEEATSLKDMIQSHFPDAKILLSTIGPIVGLHSGPGTIALFFTSTHR